MKFSILLPTRDRAELLLMAIETVRRQDYADWEIVVSDNASKADVFKAVNAIGDSRIRVLRSERTMTVTGNWNKALDASTGDYVLMLGDDDGLLPRCLSTIAALIARFDHPEVIYTQAVQYAYRDVIPWHPEPFIQTGYCRFMRGEEPFVLPPKVARACVEASLRFELTYSFNMQHFFIDQEIIRHLTRDRAFFHSPYPDYYAANALLLNASRVLVSPKPLVIIGMSPKSFGFFYFNAREREGGQMLNNPVDPRLLQDLKGTMLPGEEMNTNWLVAMETLKNNFSEQQLQVSYRSYRFEQFRSLFRSRSSTIHFIRLLLRHGNVHEIATWLIIMMRVRLLRHDLQKLLDRIHQKHPPFDPKIKSVPCEDILAVQAAWPAIAAGASGTA